MTLYEKIGNDESILTALYRYMIAAKVFGIKDDGIEVKTLPENIINDIRLDEFNHGLNGLVMLYGAGFIDEEAFCFIVKSNLDMSTDIAEAENRVIADNDKLPEERLSGGQVENALLCAAYSGKYSAFQRITFSEALTVLALPHINVKKGLVRAADLDFYRFAVELGKPMGYIDSCGELFVESQENLILLCEEDDFDPCSDGAPIFTRLSDTIGILKVYDLPYGKDYIWWAKSNELQLDIDGYNEYLRKTKLHFSIRSYTKKRSICGDYANWFDYAAFLNGNISDNLQCDYEKEIDLEASETYDDEELVRKAIGKFRGIYVLEDKTVIQAYQNEREYLFMIKDNDVVSIDKGVFHKQLFDFNKLWSIIQMCSRNGQLRKVDNRIVIPEDVWNEIAPNDREYALRLIKEQYQLMIARRKNNKLLQSLGDLKSAAAEERKRKEEVKAAQQARSGELEEKKRNRKPSTEE